jgi:hypothetical protein
MERDDQMMMELLMQDEADAAADQVHEMMVLTTLLRYCEKLNAVPRRGGLRVGKAKNKNQHRLGGALLLDSDYFVDDAANTPKEFLRHFQMNKELIMKIVFGVREYDDYFMCKPDCCGYVGSRNARLPYGALRMEHHVI